MGGGGQAGFFSSRCFGENVCSVVKINFCYGSA